MRLRQTKWHRNWKFKRETTRGKQKDTQAINLLKITIENTAYQTPPPLLPHTHARTRTLNLETGCFYFWLSTACRGKKKRQEKEKKLRRRSDDPSIRGGTAWLSPASVPPPTAASGTGIMRSGAPPGVSQRNGLQTGGFPETLALRALARVRKRSACQPV